MVSSSSYFFFISDKCTHLDTETSGGRDSRLLIERIGDKVNILPDTRLKLGILFCHFKSINNIELENKTVRIRGT